MLTSVVGRLRIIALIEGFSYLFLLFVAMPLKYGMGMPEAVKFTGMTHGMLFLLFCFALMQATMDKEWKITFAIKVFASAVVPFGTFWMDGKLKKLMPSEE